MMMTTKFTPHKNVKRNHALAKYGASMFKKSSRSKRINMPMTANSFKSAKRRMRTI